MVVKHATGKWERAVLAIELIAKRHDVVVVQIGLDDEFERDAA